MSGVLQCGLDYATNQIKPVSVNANGELEMTAEIDSSGLATSANQTNGDQRAKCMGSEDGTPTGTQKQLHLDGSGNVQTNIVNTVNVAPANSTNAHITDDPANSVAVGLTGRTTISTATTQQFLLCDSDGHLQVDVVSGGGGGGDATAANQTTMISSLSTIAGDTTSLDGKITTCNTGAVVVSSSALPTGGATSALQTSGNTSLSTLAGAVSGSEFQCDVVSSALPTGAATAANQATGNTSLASLAGCVSGTELQVDIVSGGGGGTQFAVDSALGATPTGTLLIGRNGSGNADDVLITNANELRVADTTAQTSLATLAGAVTGSEVQVDIVSAGGVATETTLAAAEAHLGTIDTSTASVAGCVNGSELQVDIISAGGIATETTLAAAEAHLGTIDTEITSLDSKKRPLNNDPSDQTGISVSAGGDASSNSINTEEFGKWKVVVKDNSGGSLSFMIEQSWDNSNFIGQATSTGTASRELFLMDGTSAGHYFCQDSDGGIDLSGGAGAPLESYRQVAKHIRVSASNPTGSAHTFDVHWYRMNDA